MTHNRLPPLFYSKFVIRITVILGVQVGLVNISMPHTFCFSFTGISSLSFCFILLVLFFIWKKVNRKGIKLINIKQQQQYNVFQVYLSNRGNTSVRKFRWTSLKAIICILIYFLTISSSHIKEDGTEPYSYLCFPGKSHLYVSGL